MILFPKRALLPGLFLIARLAALECPQPQPGTGLAHLPESLPIPPPDLGITTERVSDEVRHQLPILKPAAGLIVREIQPRSPAEKAGIGKLDILTHWNDQMLVHPSQLQVLAASVRAGEKVSLEFLQRGKPVRVDIPLGSPAPPTPGTTPNPSAKPVDPAAIAKATEAVDLSAAARSLIGAGKSPAAPTPKYLVVAPDGKRSELAPAVLEGTTWPEGRILRVMPDGTEQEVKRPTAAAP